MEIEKYFIKVDPERVLSTIIEERVNMAEANLKFAEKLIKEKLGDKLDGINLPLWIGNSVKSLDEFFEFIKLLESKGMEKEDLRTVKDLLSEARDLLGFD